MSAIYDLKPSLGHAIFDHAQLGDKRRNKSLADSFDIMTRNPAGTLPAKMSNPADLRAFYRLCSCCEVTHETLIDAVRKHTFLKMAAVRGPILILHDATELDYTAMKSLYAKLAQIGNGGCRGYICQNVLAVDATTGEVIGLLDQILHRRAKTPAKETKTQLRVRSSRESLLWPKGTEHLPAQQQLIDVCDRGADTFEFLEHECHSGRRFVIRSSKVRKVHPGHLAGDNKQYLADYVQGLPELGSFTMDVQSQCGGRRTRAQPRKGRKDALFLVQGGALLVCRPHVKTGFHGDAPLPMFVVKVTEQNPPKGQKPMTWTLLTNEPVKTLDDAWEILEWYERRWIIEEFHKAMKTGCKIEELQFTTVERLGPAIALLSALAVTLLEMRDFSRMEQAKTKPAEDVIDRAYVNVLSLWRFNESKKLTVHEFFFALARLGGHQNRTGDHPPGWLIIWRGWAKLQSLLIGYEAASRQKCGTT